MTAYSFKFHQLRIGTSIIHRPLLQVLMTGPTKRLETIMLVDSGADVSMIQLELAEQLGLPLNKVETTGGISGDLPVYRTAVQAQIRYGDMLLPLLQLPIQVPTEHGRLPLALLGRDLFFHEFDIDFRMGYTPTKGKFVLRPVGHRRKAEDYR